MRLPAVSAVAVALLAGSPAVADQLILKNGNRISGILVERQATRVVIDVGPGRLAIPMASVDKIVTGASPLSKFAERAARLSPQDREGWLDLALWARDAGLETQAQECFARVLALDPQNALAQAGVGNVLLNGRWLTPDEAQRARGYVRFEGAWMTPEERDERQRESDVRRELERARAAERVAEAEARARAAEERAAEAEYSSGLPLWYAQYGGYGYGYGGYGGYLRPGGGGPWHGRPGHGVRPTPPRPAPRPVMRDTGGSASRPTSPPPAPELRR
jgi:hypothetical protein